MPFGLLNTTYQRLMNKTFEKQIRKGMEVYVDDMLVKSKEDKDHIQHLSKMFGILRGYMMKLNSQRTIGQYNGKVITRPLHVGDLVLRKVMPNTKVAGHGVFGANWKGPYKIKFVIWGGTYHSVGMKDKLVPRAWNVEHLRKYYQ